MRLKNWVDYDLVQHATLDHMASGWQYVQPSGRRKRSKDKSASYKEVRRGRERNLKIHKDLNKIQ